MKKPQPTMKSQARKVFNRRVKRVTFVEKVVLLGATRSTAKSWWTQFSKAN